MDNFLSFLKLHGSDWAAYAVIILFMVFGVASKEDIAGIKLHVTKELHQLDKRVSRLEYREATDYGTK